MLGEYWTAYRNMSSTKILVGIIIVLVVVVVSLLYYFVYLQKPDSVVLAQQQVTDRGSAEKASSDVKSTVGDIQKELADIESVLPK